MQRSLAIALTVAVVAAGGNSWAQRPRIAVLPLDGDLVDEGLLRRMDGALADGLRAAGAELIATQAWRTAPGQTECDSGCLKRLVETTDCRYVVRGSVRREGSSYRAHLEIVDPRTGAVEGKQDDACEICTEHDTLEFINLNASALKAQATKRTGAAGSHGSSEAGAAPAVISAAAAAPAAPTASAKTQGTSVGWVRPLSIAALGAGLVAIAAGVYLVSIDGDGTCSGPSGDECERLYKTMVPGTVSIIGGVALAGAGGLLLLFGDKGDQNVNVSLGVGSVLLRGRF